MARSTIPIVCAATPPYYSPKTSVSGKGVKASKYLLESIKDVWPEMIVESKRKSFAFRPGTLSLLGAALLFCIFPCRAQQRSVAIPPADVLLEPHSSESFLVPPQTEQQQPGNIRGTIVDQTGAPITGATVTLAREGESSGAEVFSDENGLFFFSNVAPGPFRLSISTVGLTAQEFSGNLHSCESYLTPLFRLIIATQVTEVRVALSPEQIADAQVKDQERQRVFGFIPNFYVSYVPDAAPLAPRHKFALAWKSATDPVTFAAVGVVAGFDQAGDRWGAYGQGTRGYARRFGATYGDVFAGTFIGSAILPTVLKQDPRYFYKGRGSKRSRIFYALANSVICKGDNRHWQPNFSSIAGNLAAGGLSNLYYPANDRNGIGTVVSTALIRLGETAVANIFQEFISPKVTRNIPPGAVGQP